MIPQRMPPPPDAIGWTPNSLGPSSSQIINNIWPLTPGAASTAAQIAQALILAGSGLARIDAFLTAAQMATINTVPITVIPAIAGSILVPVIWSMSKTVSAIGAANTVLQLEYADAAWAGFTSITAFNADTNNARPGQYIGMPSVGLTNTLVGVRDATSKALRIIGSADPGNFPATQITARFSIFFYAWTP